MESRQRAAVAIGTSIATSVFVSIKGSTTPYFHLLRFLLSSVFQGFACVRRRASAASFFLQLTSASHGPQSLTRAGRLPRAAGLFSSLASGPGSASGRPSGQWERQQDEACRWPQPLSLPCGP